ncbi:MAG: DNA polymerase III subunit delta [Pseudomonadota bacterium]
MRVYAEQLANQLEKSLSPVYLISGDEPLLLQECSDLVRKHAREQGCSDREVLDVASKRFNWQELLHSANSMSLFAERKLIELRLPDGKPGSEGSKALCEYLEIASGDDVLLIVAGKIDKQSTNSKWFKALDKAGVITQVWPVDAGKLPQWLRRRLATSNLEIDDDALQLLCDRVEGNLLAAVQEVQKLKLLVAGSRISAHDVMTAVADSARYTVFELGDKALSGNTGASLRVLHGLRSEGTEPPVVLWALTREIRALYSIMLDCEQGSNSMQAINAHRIWKSRVPLVQSALSRHDLQSISQMLEQALETDGSIKGFANGNPWDHLERLVVSLTRANA